MSSIDQSRRFCARFSRSYRVEKKIRRDRVREVRDRGVDFTGGRVVTAGFVDGGVVIKAKAGPLDDETSEPEIEDTRAGDAGRRAIGIDGGGAEADSLEVTGG